MADMNDPFARAKPSSINPDPSGMTPFERLLKDSQERLREMLRPVRDTFTNVSGRGALNFGATVLNTANQYVVNPVMAGTMMPFNPLNPVDAFAKVLNIGTNYNQQLFQTRAFMGQGGGRAATSDFDTSGVDRFTKSLQDLGATRSDAMQTMQALVTMSRQVSSSMSDATMSVMNFSRATGLDRGMTSAIAGQSAVGSNLTLDRNNTNQLLMNMRTLAGGNSALIAPMAQGVQTFREMMMQRGQTITFDNRSVDNATNLMAGFKALNPVLYGQRPDIAARHLGQLQSAGSGPLLGIAMDVAARAGKSTRIVDVMEAIQNGEQWMMTGLGREVGSEGLSDFMALNGMDASFVKRLGRNPGALGTQFQPEVGVLDGSEFTSQEEKQRARMMQFGEDTGGGLSAGAAGLMGRTPGWVGWAGWGASLGASFFLGKKAAAGRLRDSFRSFLPGRTSPWERSFGPMAEMQKEIDAMARGSRWSRAARFAKGGRWLGPLAAVAGAVESYSRYQEGDKVGSVLSSIGTVGLASMNPWGIAIGGVATVTNMARDWRYADETRAHEAELEAEQDENANLMTNVRRQRYRNLLNNVHDGAEARKTLSLVDEIRIDAIGDVFRAQNPGKRIHVQQTKNDDGSYRSVLQTYDERTGRIDGSSEQARTSIQRAVAEAENRMEGAYAQFGFRRSETPAAQDPAKAMSDLTVALQSLTNAITQHPSSLAVTGRSPFAR